MQILPETFEIIFLYKLCIKINKSFLMNKKSYTEKLNFWLLQKNILCRSRRLLFGTAVCLFFCATSLTCCVRKLISVFNVLQGFLYIIPGASLQERLTFCLRCAEGKITFVIHQKGFMVNREIAIRTTVIYISLIYLWLKLFYLFVMRFHNEIFCIYLSLICRHSRIAFGWGVIIVLRFLSLIK